MTVRDELDLAWAEWQNAELYKKWRRSNPGEAAKLDAYRAGGSRPVLATATGRALVAETAAWIASAPVEPPPPPPDGTLVGPGQLLAAISAAQDGDTLLIDGASVVNNLNITKRLTLTSTPGKTGTIVGRLVFRAAGIVVEGLRLDGKYAGQLGNEPSWTVGAPDCVIRGCDMTNQNTAIGINQVSGGDRLLVERCNIHHVGKFAAAASAFEQPMLHKDGRYSGNRDHGIYLAASAAIVRDCEIWACSDRGVQFRGAQGARAERVWVHDCGMGFMYGDLNASNNAAFDCRAENNTVSSRALVESYQPGTGNSYQGAAVNADGRRAVNAPGVTVTLVGVVYRDVS